MQVSIDGLEFHCVPNVMATIRTCDNPGALGSGNRVSVQFIGPRDGYYGYLMLTPTKAQELAHALMWAGQEQRELNTANEQMEKYGTTP